MRALRLQAGLCALALVLAACTATPVPSPRPVPPTPVPAAPTAVPPSLTSPAPAATRVPPTATPGTVQVTVYFTDRNRFATGTPPFEVGVTRSVPATANLPEAVLAELFKGPTAEEKARGLEAVTSGFTGFRTLQVQDGIACLYLTGPCTSHGATYTVAQPILKNLLQFQEIKAVKIYDADGVTTEPGGLTNSIPPCLEP